MGDAFALLSNSIVFTGVLHAGFVDLTRCDRFY